MAGRASMKITEGGDMAAVIAELTALQRATVTVGFHADDKPRTEGEATNATIAAAHEFGTDTIRRRPFLAPAIDKGKGELAALQEQVIGAALDGKMRAEDACGIVGEKAVALVRAEISSNPPPELAESTIAAKGSSQRLINTGQMRTAVSYKVDLLGKGEGDA